MARSLRPWEICGEARNGKDAVEMAKRLRPDVAVLDINMPVMNGLEAATQIEHLGLGCRTLMFTMHEYDRLALEVRSSGAQGYVLKSQAARDLIRAIDYVLGGETFFGVPPETDQREKPMPDRGTRLRRARKLA